VAILALEKALENLQRRAPDLFFIALCGFALIKGIHATADVSWPYDLDQYRDLGMAQAILDGRYGTDHLYLGESIWYNPLVSLLVAIGSHLTGLPPYLVIARGGPYLNVLAPITFYLLAAYLFDRWIALAASAAFLFGPIGDTPSWATASYSPWLFTQNFVQACFYLALVAYYKALSSRNWRWYFAAGLALGLTFLGHTAPAVILGVIMVVSSLRAAINSAKPAFVAVFSTRAIRGLGLIVAIAFIVSLPFSFSVVWHYHLRMVNSAATNWLYPPLSVAHLSDFVRSNLSWLNAVSVVGLVVFLFDRRNSPSKTILLSWLAICVLELALNFLQQAGPTNLHLMFVPAHHFLFYLSALLSLFFGIGLVSATRFLVAFVSKRFIGGSADRNWIEALAPGVGLTLFFVFALPTYGGRFDFTTARDEAIGFQERKAYLDAYHWILANTKPTDVFLSLTGDLDLSIVCPADRKVVVTCQPEFSNPYVAWKSRADTASQIVDKLAQAAPDALSTLIEHKIAYLITSPTDRFDSEPFSFLSKVFAEDDVIIYRVLAKSETQSRGPF
jgi:hypothetical protein